MPPVLQPKLRAGLSLARASVLRPASSVRPPGEPLGLLEDPPSLGGLPSFRLSRRPSQLLGLCLLWHLLLCLCHCSFHACVEIDVVSASTAPPSRCSSKAPRAAEVNMVPRHRPSASAFRSLSSKPPSASCASCKHGTTSFHFASPSRPASSEPLLAAYWLNDAHPEALWPSEVLRPPPSCDPPTNCVTESGLWCGAAWLGGVTPVPKSHAPLWGMKIVRRYRMYNIHRVPLQPPQKCKKGIMDQTPSITTVSYEEEWSRPAVQLERGQGNKSSRGVQTGCVVTRLFPTHAQECRSFAGHQWPRLGSKARVPQTKETRAKTPGLGSLGFRISGLDQAQKKARKP